MRELAPDLPTSDVELVAEPACCPGGVCGPIFETPLLELAFNRLRDLVRRTNTTSAAPIAANPVPGHPLPTAPAVAATPPHPQKDAPHD
jgi:hypothetical protein